MRKILIFALSILIFSILGSFSLPKAYAAISLMTSPSPICQDSGKYTLTFEGTANTFVLGADYSLGIWPPNTDTDNYARMRLANFNISKNPISTTTYRSDDIKIQNEKALIGKWHYKLWLGKGTDVLKQDPTRLLIPLGEYIMYPKEACQLGLPVLEMPGSAQIGTAIPIRVININPSSDYVLWFLDGQTLVDGRFTTIINETIKDSSGNDKAVKTATLDTTLDNVPGTKTLCLKHGKTIFGFGKDACEISLQLDVTTSPLPAGVLPPINQSGQPGASLSGDFLFTEPLGPPPPCAEGKFINEKCTAFDTAIGQISTDPAKFIQFIYGVVLGLSGGIALIMIIISGYKFMASQGNPESMKAATEGLTSAIVGLLFIIFAFVILQIVGVDILQIPGFK